MVFWYLKKWQWISACQLVYFLDLLREAQLFKSGGKTEHGKTSSLV